MPDREDIMNEILTRLARIETKIDGYKPQLDDHENRIRELEGKSGKRWDAVVISIITSVLVGIVGFAIGKVF